MDENKFTTWKYRHEGPGYRHPALRIAALVALVLALPAWSWLPPIAIGLALLAALLFFGSAKKLYLGPRYLICGKSIVYYGNVVGLVLDEEAGRLTLRSANNKTLVLEREKFPTNARKKDKIARNKAAKFDKAVFKIIDKVQRASPEVEISNLTQTG